MCGRGEFAGGGEHLAGVRGEGAEMIAADCRLRDFLAEFARNLTVSNSSI